MEKRKAILFEKFLFVFRRNPFKFTGGFIVLLEEAQIAEFNAFQSGANHWPK